MKSLKKSTFVNLFAALAFFAFGCGQPSVSQTSNSGGSRLAALDSGDRFFMVLYGYDGHTRINLPRNTHSWGVFIKARGGDLATGALDLQTISWLPEDAAVGLFEGIKVGRNFSHQESLNLAAARRLRVQRTGVVEIHPELFRLASERTNQLVVGGASRRVLYSLINDLGSRRAVVEGVFGGAVNCIHALSDLLLAAGYTPLITGDARGFAATQMVFQYFRPYILGFDAQADAAYSARLGR